MKKTILILTALVFLIGASAVQAEGKALGKIKQDKDQTATAAGKVRQTLLEGLREKFPFLLPAGINQATITVGPGTAFPTTIKVNKEGKGEITLNLTDKTQLLRKYGGKSSLAELRVGDLITARGTWQDSDKAILNARVVKDLSVQKRKGTFWGKIKSTGGNSFVLDTVTRGDLTVTIASGTKIVDRRERPLTLTDLLVAHRVRVSGVWDTQAKTLTEVTVIKDWSLAPKPSGTVTPTSAPTAVPTTS